MSGWEDSGCSDGWDSSGCSIGEYDDEREEVPNTPPSLEEAYKATVARVKPQIEECCKMGAQAYADAARLAEAHSIPFDTQIIKKTYTYVPVIDTAKLSREVVGQVTGEWIDSSTQTGWTNSSDHC